MANQTQILNVSDEMKLNDNVQMKNVKEQEENMYSSSSDTTEELCSSSVTDTCGKCNFVVPKSLSYEIKLRLDINVEESWGIGEN